jgi:hypothetical protein
MKQSLAIVHNTHFQISLHGDIFLVVGPQAARFRVFSLLMICLESLDTMFEP